MVNCVQASFVVPLPFPPGTTPTRAFQTSREWNTLKVKQHPNSQAHTKCLRPRTKAKYILSLGFSGSLWLPGSLSGSLVLFGSLWFSLTLSGSLWFSLLLWFSLTLSDSFWFSLPLSASRHSDAQPLLQDPRAVLGSVCGGSGSWGLWVGHLYGAGWGQRTGTEHWSDIGPDPDSCWREET